MSVSAYKMPKWAFDEITTILGSVEDAEKEALKIVPMKDRILAILLMAEVNGACKGRHPPKSVGVHPGNRDDEMVDENGVHDIGHSICAIGVSEHAIKGAVAFEDHPINRHIEKATRELTELSSRLAHFAPGSIKIGTVGCSHTNQFFCCVIDEVETDYDELATNGRIDRARLEMENEGLAELLFNGILFDAVIRWEVEEMFPTMPRFLQSALNASSNIHQQPRFTQTLNKIQHEIAKQRKSSGTVNMKLVMKRTLASRGVAEHDVIPMCGWVETWGGGEHGIFISQICKFAKAFVPAKRVIPSFVWAVLADLKLPPTAMCGNFIAATIELIASCPDQFVGDAGVIKYVSRSELSTIASSRKNDVAIAEKCIATCKELLCKHESTTPVRQQVALLGRLDTRLARIVYGKRFEAEMDWPLLHPGHLFFQELSEVLGVDISTLSCPYMSATADAPRAGRIQTSAHQQAVMSFDDKGNAVDAGKVTLLNKGFSVSQCVKLKADKSMLPSLFVIKAIKDDGSVLLAELGSADGLAYADLEIKLLDAFLDKYCSSTAKRELLANYPQIKSTNNPSYATVQMYRSLTQAAVITLDVATPVPAHRIQEKPYRGVFLEEKVKKDIVRLVPGTFRVADIDPRKPIKGQHVVADVAGGTDAMAFALCPLMPTDTIAVPFWCIRGVSDQSEVNMKLVDVVVECPLPLVGPLPKTTTKLPTLSITVPCLVNTKALAMGCELLIFKAKPQETEKRAILDIGSSSSSKRAKS